MQKRLRFYRYIWLKHDLPAGLSVFLIALPLCLGIALASGAPLYAGLLSGIIGGVVVSIISGSALGVSGPAAGLTTVVAASIVSLGDYKIFLLAVIIAGLFQIILGLLKLGTIVSYFPSAVIKGMLAAIGLILISKQIPVALGYTLPDFWSDGMKKIFTIAGGAMEVAEHISLPSVIISFVALALLFAWQHPLLKNAKVIPAPLVAVAAGTGLALVLGNPQIQLVNIPANIFENITAPDFSQILVNKEIWKDGLVIGLLATIETLLCIEAVDKLDKHNRITPVNRELLAQGAGNIVCGLLGAIPITAVVVRGSANVDAGGRTKLSAFTHGVFLLLAVLFIPFVLCRIPYAALAAVLCVTGFNLTRPRLYRQMWQLGYKQFVPFIITVLVILFTDLLTGVAVGLVVSTYFIVQNNFKADYKITKTTQHDTEVFYIKLNSNVTFLNKVNLQKAIDQIPEYSVLTIDGSECNFIDYDILEVISNYETKAKDRHIEVHLKGIEKVKVMAAH